MIKKLFILFIVYLFHFNFSSTQEIYSNYKYYTKSNIEFKLTKVSEGLNFPWGITFIDDLNLIVTEKNGKIFKINTQS